MVINTDHKAYKKLVKKGSALQGFRRAKGLGMGLFAGGLTLVLCGLFITLMFAIVDLELVGVGLLFLAFFGVIALPMMLIGGILWRKRNNGYLAYYQKITGYSPAEIETVEQELAGKDITVIAYRIAGSLSKNALTVGAIITPHYFVTESYVRRLEEIVAAFYCESVDKAAVEIVTGGTASGLVCLAKTDKKACYMPFNGMPDQKEDLCSEIIGELCRRNPAVIPAQYVLCEGNRYDLLQGSQEVNRLLAAGYPLSADNDPVFAVQKLESRY